MSLVWDGITTEGVVSEGSAAERHRLADAAKAYDWTTVLALLHEHPGLVNTTRPGGASLFAPLHQAAHGNAPPGVLEALIGLGAWRMLLNVRGERPVDVAERCGHGRAAEILRPVLRRRVPAGILAAMQAHFHAVIRGRADDLVRKASLRLPELGPLLEVPGDEPVWFAVPGMYGGFAYRLRSDGVKAVLVAESWCRVVGGSGQRHEITSAGSRLVEEGFV
ncbi:ankyrin repeat domain-containing protein [Methylobacterium sp. NI91]|nr:MULTISPECIES: ankyrin repeat domain-containing protein [unclassified Methylobacterium]QIJ76934.1 ankyrin repeat domain-containing protein [Methylobacterium sp. CLZ]QIJ81838.1 ankyrin repeat domain-containing protein [Methylobacterium sp. NI91]